MTKSRVSGKDRDNALHSLTMPDRTEWEQLLSAAIDELSDFVKRIMAETEN